jgi:hypothetical protein
MPLTIAIIDQKIAILAISIIFKMVYNEQTLKSKIV